MQLEKLGIIVGAAAGLGVAMGLVFLLLLYRSGLVGSRRAPSTQPEDQSYSARPGPYVMFNRTSKRRMGWKECWEYELVGFEQKRRKKRKVIGKTEEERRLATCEFVAPLHLPFPIFTLRPRANKKGKLNSPRKQRVIQQDGDAGK